MSEFQLPDDITFNQGPVADPTAFAEAAGAEGWLYLNGPEFAEMENGMSYEQVQVAVPVSVNVVSDPPRVLTADLAREHFDALDELPRPTLVTCRAGPRASAVVYLYAGLKSGATADEVLARADADGAPFTAFEDYRTFVTDALAELGSTDSA